MSIALTERSANNISKGVFLLLYACPAMAGSSWQKCDLTVHVTDTRDHQVTAQVLAVKAKPDTECPSIGDQLAFVPQTKDWQSELPRRQWAKPGTTWRVRYQYLDGICKNDGDEKPCRIKRYPVNS